jgi:hypothetical protein
LQPLLGLEAQMYAFFGGAVSGQAGISRPETSRMSLPSTFVAK